MTIVTSDSAKLGDNLMLTPLLNAQPCTLRLYDEEWMRFTAEIFKGLCEIEWATDRAQIQPPLCADLPRSLSKRLLVAHGLNNVSAIPQIKLTEAELADGRNWASKVQKAFGKPLCILKAVPGHGGSRSVFPEIIDEIVAANPDVQFVAFNLGDNHPKKELRSAQIKGVFEMINLPIRAQASCYAAVGRYVGADTGDYHLMLSVGGKADVLCPAHSDTYDWWLAHYGDDCWLDEAVRVTYQSFESSLSEGVTGIRL